MSRIPIALLVLVLARDAVACPFCSTDTGRRIYAGIFDASFAQNALLVLAPFPALLAASMGLLWLLPLSRKSP
jgi:hypothetical protein